MKEWNSEGGDAQGDEMHGTPCSKHGDGPGAVSTEWFLLGATFCQLLKG